MVRLYYQYIPEGKEYPVLYRRSDVEKSSWFETVLRYARGGVGREEILLDWNEMAEKYGKFFSCSLLSLVHCHVSKQNNYNKLFVFLKL